MTLMLRSGKDAFLAALLPNAAIKFAEQDDSCLGLLLEEERQSLPASTVESRLKEFAAGRTCARSALAELGCKQEPILIGDQRQPLWPTGVVGSITHCRGYCGAAAAHVSSVETIGIDADENSPMPNGVLSIVASSLEIERISACQCEYVALDKLIFSAKESVYKAWYPIEKSWLDFRDASVTIDPSKKTFLAVITRPRKKFPDSVQGRFLFTEKHIITAISLT